MSNETNSSFGQKESQSVECGSPILKITKLFKDSPAIDISHNNGTTTIKLDKYRVEVPSAVKINIG